MGFKKVSRYLSKCEVAGGHEQMKTLFQLAKEDGWRFITAHPAGTSVYLYFEKEFVETVPDGGRGHGWPE